MPIAIDISKLAAPAQKVALGQVPLKLQELAAQKGTAIGVGPADMLAILVVFSTCDRETVRSAAIATLGDLPPQLLQGALAADLQAGVIDDLTDRYMDRFEVIERLVQMTHIATETVERLARGGDERITELVATNEARLLAAPTIIERLYLNKRTRSSTADRLIDLASRNGVTLTGIAAFKEAALALQNELIAEPSDEPLPDDVAFAETVAIAEELAATTAPDEDTHVEDDEGKEQLKEKFKPLYIRIGEMKMSEKIRTAMLGTKEERMLLVRDNNRLVASAAVRSPMMQENEISLVARNRNVPDEVLRIIGTTPEWLKSYAIKRALVENPKTPPSISTRLVLQLRESDLRHIAKSKNVAGPVQDAARRHLDRRKT